MTEFKLNILNKMSISVQMFYFCHESVTFLLSEDINQNVYLIN